MPWPYLKIVKPCAFSEEDVAVVSKADTVVVWAGSKIMYSGSDGATASGYNYWSGESDVEPYNLLSGTGQIRIPELNQLHKIFVFPRNPRFITRPTYRNLTLGTTSGLPGGDGGCSGKVALLEWSYLCSGPCARTSGGDESIAGTFTSGIVDVIAFGSQY